VRSLPAKLARIPSRRTACSLARLLGKRSGQALRPDREAPRASPIHDSGQIARASPRTRRFMSSPSRRRRQPSRDVALLNAALATLTFDRFGTKLLPARQRAKGDHGSLACSTHRPCDRPRRFAIPLGCRRLQQARRLCCWSANAQGTRRKRQPPVVHRSLVILLSAPPPIAPPRPSAGRKTRVPQRPAHSLSWC
jgi:hypothetical protein